MKTIKIFCAGLIGWDTIGHPQVLMHKGADLPGSITTNIGGVIANVAITLTNSYTDLINLEVNLLSCIGNDQKSDLLLSLLSKNHNINCDNIIRLKGSTDGYIGIESDQKLFAAVASSSQLEKAGTKIFEPIIQNKLNFKNGCLKDHVIIDSNLTKKTLDFLASDPFFDEVPFIIACASTFKAKKVRSLLIKRKCVIYSNLEEASAILGRKMACSTKAADSLFALGAREAIVTNGKNKVSCRSVNGLATHIPTLAINSKITGAGDTFLAVHLLSKLVNNKLSEQTHLQIADSKAYQKIVN